MTLVLYLENISMYRSPTIKKGRAHCSLWALWGLPVRMGAPAPLGSPPAGNIQFHSTEVRGSIPGKTSGPGWAQCPEAVVPCCGTTQPWLSVCSPIWSCLGIFCYLLVLHFVDCFVSLGLSLVSVSLSHLAASSYFSQTICSVLGQHECWCGSGHGYDWQAQGKGSLGPGTQVGRQGS